MAGAALAVPDLSGSCLTPAAGRDRPPAAAVLPGAGGRPVRIQRPLPGLSRILALLGCGVGAATRWRDVPAVAPGRMSDPRAALPLWRTGDETWLSIGGEKHPVAVVLGPQGLNRHPETRRQGGDL